MRIANEILMHLRCTKKLGAEVFLDEPIGKDKDDNTVTLQEILENNERSIEEIVDIKLVAGIVDKAANSGPIKTE